MEKLNWSDSQLNQNPSSPFSYPFLILAAGYGSRLEEKTRQTPKSILSLTPEGDTSLSLLLDTLQTYNSEKICITGGFRFEEMQLFLKKRYGMLSTLELIDARPSFSKGPLYSFLSAEKCLIQSELFWLFPADTLFIPPFFQWFETQQFSLNRIHLFLRSSLISEAELERIFNSWKNNPSSFQNFPFLPYLFPFMGLSGPIFLAANRCQVDGGKKVIDIFSYIENLSSILQIHLIPKDIDNFLDLDSLNELNTSQSFIYQFWGDRHERC